MKPLNFKSSLSLHSLFLIKPLFFLRVGSVVVVVVVSGGVVDVVVGVVVGGGVVGVSVGGLLTKKDKKITR